MTAGPPVARMPRGNRKWHQAHRLPLFAPTGPTRCHALEFQNRPMNEIRSDLTPDASLLAGRDNARSRALLRSGLLERAGETQFRLIAEHVRVMLDVPVALVTLVGSDRQFFAASPGLPEPGRAKAERRSTCRSAATWSRTAGP